MQSVEANRYEHPTGILATKFQNTCWGSKYVYPVCISSTENLQSHLMTNFRINTIYYDQCKQTGQQPTTQRW